MVNAALVAMEFNSMLPSADTPRDTEDYEGFFHLYSIKGDVSHAALEYIIRDHNATIFDVRKKTMEHITKILNEKWGKGTVSLTITEQYRNMKEIIDTCMELIEHATAACKEMQYLATNHPDPRRHRRRPVKLYGTPMPESRNRRACLSWTL